MHTLRHMTELSRGSPLSVPWSSNTIVTDILCTLVIEGRTFHGISAKNVDPSCLDWPRSECLLWVTPDGNCVRRWEDIPPRPCYGNLETPLQLERILAHHELNGEMYFGIKWESYALPTWELEGDLDDYADALTDYCLNLCVSAR